MRKLFEVEDIKFLIAMSEGCRPEEVVIEWDGNENIKGFSCPSTR